MKNIETVYEKYFDLFLQEKNYKNKIKIFPIFTVNYDMSIDWFFRPPNSINRKKRKIWEDEVIQCQINFCDGFGSELEWDENEYKSISDIDENSFHIEYHKLHGSLFWEESDGVICKSRSIARDILLEQKLVLVYPSDKKILTENPFYYSHRALDKYLLKTDILFIIGFSFRDPALVQAFQYALSANEKLHIYVINPHFEENDFYELSFFISSNMGRVTHIEEYFGTEECFNAVYKITENSK